MEKYTSGDCTICTKYFSLLHWHHTIPQALGGVNSLQIPLCSDCHNVLHAHANAIVARIRSLKPIKKNFWPRPGDLERAQKWLEILVQSILHPPVQQEDKEYKLQTTVPANIHAGLMMLKSELPQLKSLDQAVLYCIAHTLKSRGLHNDNRRTERTSKGESESEKPATDLW